MQITPDSKPKTKIIDQLLLMKEKWPSTIVSRKKVPEFSGYTIATGTMANEDCKGTGPEGRFRIGSNICYPVDSLIDWLIARAENAGGVANG